ncbi:tyrosine--tRNA ligase, partial [Staphylococcus aureus]|uniref:tyrosine--tRNA ligase n=1 Tax=Staphylococcus aureus TaxID=1280 RepID=UPI00168A4C3D
LKADGTKFGKTAGGAIWLDPKRTSPYEFYQFWLNQDDRDVIKYLKFFTFLDKEEIDFLEEKVKNEPEKRKAQKRLAEEVTKFVHDEAALQEAQKITQALFSGNVKDLTVKEIEQGLQNMPSFNTTNKTKNIVDWLVEINCEASKRQAREDVINGAININGEKVTDINFLVNPNSAFEGKYM